MCNDAITTGFSSLDRVLGGLRPGTLNVFAGRPLEGKTSLALDIAKSVAGRSGKAVVYFSKDNRINVVRRVIESSMQKNQLIGDCESISKMTGGVTGLPIYIDDRMPHAALKYIITRIEGLLFLNVDIGLVIIDDIECLKKDTADIKSIFNTYFELKGNAVEFGIPVIAIAKVPKDFEYGEKGFHGSADIVKLPFAETADNIVFVYNPACLSPRSALVDKGRYQFDAKLLIVKNKFGDKDIAVNMLWDCNRLTFQAF